MREAEMRTDARNGCILTIALACLLLAPYSAAAHHGGSFANGLLSGFSHPFSGFDHMLAMTAVGLWGAQFGAPAIYLLPISFLVMMAVGGFLGIVGMPLPLDEFGIASSSIVLGVAVAIESHLAVWIAMLIVGGFAIFHGHVHGSELAPEVNALEYSIGLIVATGLLQAIGIAIGLIGSSKRGELAVQGVGAGVALAGVVLLVRVVT
jgi:urease accessory protein